MNSSLINNYSEVIKKKGSKKKRPFLKHIHYFRGFAIINVVLVHSIYLKETYGYNFDSLDMTLRLSKAFFQSSTIYFLFIAGFLFHYLSVKLDVKRFFANKAKFVIFPYIFLTILYALVIYFLVLMPKGQESFDYSALLNDLVQGKASSQYWYIPFVVVVYIISPILLRLPNKVFNILTIVCSILPLVFSRTGVDLTIYQFAHFIPIYILGISMSKYHDFYMEKIVRYKFLFLFIASATTLFLALYAEDAYYLTSFLNVIDSIQYIQKMSITFLIMYALLKVEHKNSKLLDLFATYSFGIYFLHGFVETVIFKIFHREEIMALLNNYTVVVFVLIMALLVLFTSLLVCIIAKKMLKGYSRYLIGVG